jgi:hypothetical protein
MTAAPAQARALDALAASRIGDRDAMATVAGLDPGTQSAEVQNAIAGVLIRADYSALDGPRLAETLRRYRLRSRDGESLVDALIRRLEAH